MMPQIKGWFIYLTLSLLFGAGTLAYMLQYPNIDLIHRPKFMALLFLSGSTYAAIVVALIYTVLFVIATIGGMRQIEKLREPLKPYLFGMAIWSLVSLFEVLALINCCSA